MAASTEQKVDFLLKKLGYSSSKTGIAEDESSLSGTKKAPFAEPIPSPLVVPDSSVWSNSEFIPTTPPGADTSYVKTYLASASGYHMTEDTTVSGSRSFVARATYNNNSTANLKNWIDTQFGADYIVKVYKGDPNSGGVQLSAAGSGSNDTWFFDYSAGVLNFNGTSVPSGVTSSNIYLVGYRYIGETGVITPGDDLNIGIGTVKDLTVERNIIQQSAAGISTFTGNIDANRDVDIAGNVNVSGITTLFHLDVDGHTDLDNVNVSGVSTFAGNIDITNSGNLTIAGNLTVNGTETTLNTNSLEVEDINIGIASAASKLNDAQIDGAGITIYSSGGDKTLTWDHSNSRMAFSNDLYVPNATVGTDLTVGGNLNVTGDVVYDEVTGRNIKISGVGTITQLNVTSLTVSSGSTFTGNIDANGDLDVDGHTNLDNVSIAGVTTTVGDVTVGTGGETTAIGVRLNSQYAQIKLPDGQTGGSFKGNLFFGDNNDFRIVHDAHHNYLTSYNGDIYLGFSGGTPLKLKSGTKSAELYHVNTKVFETISSGVSIPLNLDVDGHTELDNLNVAGVSTFANNIDANRDVDIAGNVLVGGALTVTGTTTFNGGTLTLGDADTDNVVFGGEVDSNILPDDDNTFDLGSSAKRWKDVYADSFIGDGSGLTNTGASLSAASGTQRFVVTNLTSGTMTTAATDSDLVFIAGNNLLSLNGNLSVTGVATFTGPITAGSSLGAAGQYMRRTGTGVTWASFPELRQTTSFTATAGQTSFTWSHNASFLDVFLNGVKLASTEYTANGSSVVLNSGCFAGDTVEFHSYNIASNYGAGGGGSTTLPGLTDVTISGASNGQVLKYNGSAWVNAADATGGSSYTNSDVDTHLNVSGASSGQILSWNGSDYAWVADQTGGGSVGTAGTWSSTATGISTTKNVAIGGNLNVTGISTFTGIGTFGNDLYVGGNLSVLGSTNLDTQTLNVNTLNVAGVTTHTGITTYTNHVNFGGLNKKVTFFGHSNLVDQKMYWDTSSNGSLHFAPGVHSYYGGTRTQFDPHGTGSAGHFRIEQYMDEGNNPFNIHSDFTGIKGSPTGGHESRDIAKFEYLEGTRLYHTGTKRLHTSGVGVTVYGELDATSAKFSGNVSIGGTLTYEDVTNIDSVGIITAGTDIHVGAGVSAVGIITANSFRGDGSQLTGISASSLQVGADINPRHVNASGIITTTSATIGSLGISTVAGSWGANAGVGKTIDSFDVATDDFKTAEYTLWFNYSSGGVSNIQSQKLLVMQDGTTPYSQEFAIMSAPNKIVSVGATMTGTIVNINATPESGISGVTTYKLARNTLL